MGELLPFPRARAVATSNVAASESAFDRELDPAIWPVVSLLLVASVLRVVHALLRREVFDTEPTLALAAVLILPWVIARSRQKRARNGAPPS